MTFGLDPTNDVWADEIESRGLEGMEFALHYRDAHLHVRVPLLGQHSVHTALAAAAVGLVRVEGNVDPAPVPQPQPERGQCAIEKHQTKPAHEPAL